MVMTILISVIEKKSFAKKIPEKSEILVYRILLYKMMYHDISK